MSGLLDSSLYDSELLDRVSFSTLKPSQSVWDLFSLEADVWLSLEKGFSRWSLEAWNGNKSFVLE